MRLLMKTRVYMQVINLAYTANSTTQSNDPAQESSLQDDDEAAHQHYIEEPHCTITCAVFILSSREVDSANIVVLQPYDIQ